MLFALKGAASVLAGVCLGAASAWVLTGPEVPLPRKFGAWRTSARSGNKGDGLYVRASIARIAWFSNDPDRAIYLEAREDSGGEPLDIHCNYRVSGGPLPARWWSVTAYRNFHWFPNPAERYSYASSNVYVDGAGRWQIEIGPNEATGNWIPMGGNGRLSLLLRLYDPSLLDPATIPLPRIEKGSCS